jgi:transcriptional regulator with XRE-family HTH domain
MQKSLKSAEYARLISLLVAARKAADMTQQVLAEKLERPQSFVAKYENGERRIDLIEFVAIAGTLGADPVKLLRNFLAGKTPLKTSQKRTSRSA